MSGSLCTFANVLYVPPYIVRILLDTFILLVFLVIPFRFFGQALLVTHDPLKENLYTSKSYFNEKYISNNHIRSIKASLSVKQELQKIEETGKTNVYTFSNDGKLMSQFETYSVGYNSTDTIIIYYFYDDKNRIELKRTSDQQGFFSYIYKYDELGRITVYFYSRDENELNSKQLFKLKKRNIILSESYEYQNVSKKELKRTVINDIGKAYKEEFFIYDQYDNMAEYSYRYIVTGKRNSTIYSYDFYGRIIEMTESSSGFDNPDVVTLFEYDQIGNLLAEKVFKKDVLTTTKEFLYDKNMLLTAQLIKDEFTKAITIIKFSYTY